MFFPGAASCTLRFKQWRLGKNFDQTRRKSKQRGRPVVIRAQLARLTQQAHRHHKFLRIRAGDLFLKQLQRMFGEFGMEEKGG